VSLEEITHAQIDDFEWFKMYICDYRLEKKFVTYHQTGTIPKDPESNDYHLAYKMTLKYGAPE
jgi:hypothetical protein